MIKERTICIECKHCVHYLDPREFEGKDKFHIVGYNSGTDKFIEPGVFCGVAGVKLKMNVLQCSMFSEKE